MIQVTDTYKRHRPQRLGVLSIKPVFTFFHSKHSISRPVPCGVADGVADLGHYQIIASNNGLWPGGP